MYYDNRKKRYMGLYLELALLAIVATMISFAKTGKLSGSNGNEKLEIQSKIKIPLKEISGLVATQENEGYSFYAVGDKQAKVAKVKLSTKNKIKSHELYDFEDILIDKFHICHSNLGTNCRRMHDFLTTDWEAITTDHKGNLFLLQEASGNIFVFNNELSKLKLLIHLNFDQYLKGSSYGYEQNSLGEGIILLKNGHFLIAKEKHPIALIEFGPKGDKAYGINKNTILPKEETFSLPKELKGKKSIVFEQLKIWTMGDRAKCDASDLTTDSDGYLYVLSQKCKKISIYKSLSVDNNSLKPNHIYDIPRKIKNPEAITLLPNKNIVIGSDRKNKKSNIYLLKRPLPSIQKKQVRARSTN